MVQSVTLPFGALNNVPGVSGIDDVSFDIPQPDDIIDPITDAIPDPPDIEGLVVEPLDELLATVDDIQDTVAAINEQVLAGIPDAIADVQVALEDQLIQQLGDQDVPVTGIQLDPDRLADTIADEIDPEFEQPSLVSFESVFGAQQASIAAGFEKALERAVPTPPFPTFAVDDDEEPLGPDIDKILKTVTPGTEEFNEFVDEVFARAEPTINDVGLFGDPIGFGQEFVRESAEVVVDPQSAENLQQAVEEFG